MSDAIKGYGSVFERGDGADPEVFAEVAEVVSITPPQLTKETVDATHLNSPDGYREFLAGMKDAGEVTFTMAYVANGTGQSDIRDDFEADDVVNYRITLPNDATWEFSGIVTGLAPSELSIEERVTEAVTIKVSGKPIFTDAA